MKQIFLKKIYEVISIMNKKKTLFKGFTRGDPWVPSLTKQNLNRTQKNKVIALKQIKRTFSGRYKGGPLGALSHEATFKQDAKP
jgi:hypothetical protein